MPDLQGGPTKWGFSGPPWAEKEDDNSMPMVRAFVLRRTTPEPWVSGDKEFSHTEVGSAGSLSPPTHCLRGTSW